MSKTVICVLTKGYSDTSEYNQLVNRNNALASTLGHDAKLFDYFFFHEGNIPDAHQAFIQASTPALQMTFINVADDFVRELVPSSNSNEFCHSTWLSDSFPFGYKCMCRFWLHRFLQYTTDYKYVIRVDEDCVVQGLPLAQITNDMHDNNQYYMTPVFVGADEPDVVVGLNEFVENFIASNASCDIQTPVYDRNPYTNVAIFDADYFRNSNLIMAFCDAVDKSGSIFINRWGDLPLWGVILSCFVPDVHYGVDTRIKYLHGSHALHINK